MISDVRDVMVSFYFYLNYNKSPSPLRREMRRISDSFLMDRRIDRFLRHHVPRWKSHVQAWQHSGQITHLLRYRDLLQNTANELADAIDSLGVTVDRARIDEAVRRFTFEALSGGRERGETDNRAFYRRGVVGDHVNYLNQPHLDYIMRECADVLDQFRFLE